MTRRSSPGGRLRTTGWSATAVVVVMAAVLVTARPAAAGGDTTSLAEARADAEAAAQAYADAEAELGRIENELGRIGDRRDEIRSEVEDVRNDVQDVLLVQFVAGRDDGLLEIEDVNEAATADALARAVGRNDNDVLEHYRSLMAGLDHENAQYDEARRDQESALADLATERDRLNRELERLEELERQRLAEEQRRREEEQRRAAAAAAAAEERARAATTTTVVEVAADGDLSTTAPAAGPVAGDPAAGSTTAPPTSAPAPPAPPPSVPPPGGGGGGGSITCPVPGSVFVDTWGAPRSGGRTHVGVDMMASTGTPILAPVSGTVTHRSVSTGGLSFFLSGSDGRTYFGTHLSSYGQGGSVSAGTVIGYVGATGNATTPHLHLEIIVGGQNINPYPIVRAAC